mgnify:CR=1 FL=1
MFVHVNPFTGHVDQETHFFDQKQAHDIIASAHDCFLKWKLVPLDQRIDALLSFADCLEDSKEALATSITRSMGKPIKHARAEVEKSASVAQYYAKHAHQWLSDECVETEWDLSYITYRPIGPILAIMPWNYPIWQVARVLIPNMLLGNPVLLSHAPNVIPCATLLEECTQKALWPPYLFSILRMNHALCEKVIGLPQIKGVTLTGSTKAGQQVGRTAAENLKPSVMELGGSDPYLILHDADLYQAAMMCVTNRLMNAGQVCISPKRLIVDVRVYDAFFEHLKEIIKQFQIGDPSLESTDIGPLARSDIRECVHEQVIDAVEKGAVCHLGGEIPKGSGFFYPPTLLSGVKPGMRVFDEEVFGPVLCIIQASDEQEAVVLANQHDYGLGACVFSKDWQRGQQLAQYDLDVGVCSVNKPVSSHPALPFGGIKNSGYGRELGLQGLRAFANVKTICVQKK